jgi:DNA-binding CsgD family transcriptional regulator
LQRSADRLRQHERDDGRPIEDGEHESTAEALFEAVRVVARGEALLAPSVTRRLIGEFARLRPAMPLQPDRLRELTPRESEVLRLIAEGPSSGEIAERLVVSQETVKSHVSRILTKLGLRDRAQAVVVAYESGLVAPRTDDGTHHRLFRARENTWSQPAASRFPSSRADHVAAVPRFDGGHATGLQSRARTRTV